MSKTGFVATSRRLETEKAIKHLGTASVKLSVLDFPYSKGLDEKNVDRLERLFRTERGCLPCDLPNRIPAIIHESQLLQALRASNISAECLLSGIIGKPVKLEFPSGFRLECLRGRHRVEAADRVLKGLDKRWVVDLFLADITQDLKSTLIDEYTNERKPGDGEFYYMIRVYQGFFGQKNPYFERRWWARLAAQSESTNKKDRLYQLFGHREFGPAFDAFQYLPALYCGLRLSVINKMISMKSHEEILTCLKNIKDFWYYVFDNDERAMKRLDETTLRAVEGKAPGACQSEAVDLYGRVRSGELLSGFDEREQEVIWTRICSASTDCLVPSIFLFFENLNYLQVAADCMKRLVCLGRGESIYSALERGFRDQRDPDPGCLIQLSRTASTYLPIDLSDRFDLIYRQLWLYAFREYKDIPAVRKRKLAKPRTGEANELVLYEFASLANRLGFETKEIQDILQQDPIQEIARRFLTTARSQDRYEYDDFETYATQVARVIYSARPIEDDGDIDIWEVDERNRPPRRYGIPNKLDQLLDRPSMFLAKLHSPVESQGQNLTSFFIQRSTYFSFFGKELGVSLEGLSSIERDIPMDIFKHQREQVHNRPLQMEYQQLKQQHGRLQEVVENLRGTVNAEEERLERVTNEGKILQESLERMKLEESEYTKRLDKLRDEEEVHRVRLEETKQTRQKLDGEIEHLAAEKRSQLVRGEQDLGVRLEQLAEEESKRQRRINELEAEKRDKLASLEELKSQEQSQKGSMENLQSRIRGLDEDEKQRTLRIEQLSLEETKRKSTIDMLARKEAKQKESIKKLTAHVNQLRVERDKTQHKTQNVGQNSGNVPDGNIPITFKTKTEGWVTTDEILVDPSDPSQVERVAKKYMSKGYGISNTRGHMLKPEHCFERVLSDGTKTIHLCRDWQVEASRQLQNNDNRLVVVSPELGTQDIDGEENHKRNKPS